MRQGRIRKTFSSPWKLRQALSRGWRPRVAGKINCKRASTAACDERPHLFRGRNRQGLRAALAAIKGFAGAEGEYNFDEKSDGLRGYNIVKNENSKIVFDRRIEVEPT